MPFMLWVYSISVSQPFELQVSVEDKFLRYCHGKQNSLTVNSIVCFSAKSTKAM